ncbi:putative quinone oxidoreductase [Rhizodiscina lignyota]|uniref:Quinone oxidoreductase n=1 Tax=Rhizodiscina lignyota TaxID=1504668 RepID=A0A9P4HZX9_9PEZI|nr:putative quinone oxidoreductase [Rhizodiscina lignyota]
MKEALVGPDLDAEVHDVPIPKPGPGEVLIKVEVAGSNPKDWKYPHGGGTKVNSGDDMAGTVEDVGEGVLEFRKGDRVAAMHRMRTPAGSFAEYSIAPAITAFHMPANVSAEEAATIPLAALTAVLGLFYNLNLPQPWTPAQEPLPLLIYGASSAVGAFAVKLARRSNIHPIIAIAGKAKGFVESLIDPSKGDVVLDYRDGEESVIQSVRQTLGNLKIPRIKYAFDAIGEDFGLLLASKLLLPDGHLCAISPSREFSIIPKSLTISCTYVGDIHGDFRPVKTVNYVSTANAADFGYIYSRLFTRGLQEGWLTGHPYEVVAGGLAGVSTALKDLKDGKASGKKFVFRVS